MNTEMAVNIMRSGDGNLSPIIEYYNRTRLEHQLIDYINDPEISSTVLYVLSELSKVDDRVVMAVKAIVDAGQVSNKDREWSEEILMNHGSNMG